MFHVSAFVMKNSVKYLDTLGLTKVTLLFDTLIAPKSTFFLFEDSSLQVIHLSFLFGAITWT